MSKKTPEDIQALLEEVAASLSKHAADLDDLFSAASVDTTPSLLWLRDDLREVREKVRAAAYQLTPEDTT